MTTNRIFNSCFILGGALLLFTGCGSDCENYAKDVCDCAGLDGDDCATQDSYTDAEEEACATAAETWECEE